MGQASVLLLPTPTADSSDLVHFVLDDVPLNVHGGFVDRAWLLYVLVCDTPVCWLLYPPSGMNNAALFCSKEVENRGHNYV